jgi:hypothetical protein
MCSVFNNFYRVRLKHLQDQVAFSVQRIETADVN